MSKFESSIKTIAYPQESVYRMLSDFTNIERVRDRIPKDKLEQLSFDKESLSVSISPIGEVSMRIVEREEPKMIKLQSVKSPVKFTFWIQVLPVTDTTSKLRLTIDAEIPFFAKGMVTEPIKNGLDKVADALCLIPYE